MADFHKAFEAIDVDGSGEITVDELQEYMVKNNYKENFVSKWLKLFDDDNCGKITYKHYCDTLGLVPKDRKPSVVDIPDITGDAESRVRKPTSKKIVSGRTKAKPQGKQPKMDSKTSEPEIIEISEVKKDEAVMKIEVDKKEEKKTVTNEADGKRKARNPQSYPIQVKQKGPARRIKLYSQHKRRLRASIKPGVIMILLAGHHKGKRVVFLKQLESALLLVTGPFKLNGCPLRRVHQSMVIATRTQIDVSKIKLPDRVNDSYFGHERERKPTSTDVSTIFAKTKKEYVLKEERKQDQKDVDKQVLSAIKAREDKNTMAKYLKSLFSLTSHDCPHKMQF